jgi:hypothetical protein
MLTAALEVLRPSCVLELSSWYGLSTTVMLKTASKIGIGGMAPSAASAPSAPADRQPFLYCVDHFKNNAIYENPMYKLKPIDKLFLLHPRWECFAANIASVGGTGRVATWRGDIYEALPALVAAKVHPDVVFIDCEKKTRPLIHLITSVRTAWPDALIVGDDYVFDPVKAAVRSFPREDVIALDEAYILTPRGFSHDRRDCIAKAVIRVKASLAAKESELVVASAIGRLDVQSALRGCTAAGVHPLHFRVRGTPAVNVLHNIARSRDQRVLESAWPMLFSDAESWTAPIHNDVCLTPYDYLSHKIRFE